MTVQYYRGYELAVLLPLAASGCSWIADNTNNLIQSLEIKIDKDVENE